MKATKEMVGKKVRMTLNVESPVGKWYPDAGTIGTIVRYEEPAFVGCKENIIVDWPVGSVHSGFGADKTTFWINEDWVELVEDDTLMPYDEVWEMLKPKMEKNGMRMFAHPTYGGLRCFYEPEIFQKAVALAYKMGYERAMKGRPFKYGEKKV